MERPQRIEGYAKKAGKNGKGFKERYFRQEQHRLAYFPSKESNR